MSIYILCAFIFELINIFSYYFYKASLGEISATIPVFYAHLQMTAHPLT